MVKDPEKFLKQCEGWKQLARVIWHVEAEIDQAAFIKWTRSKGWRIGMAINPKTKIEKLVPFIPLLDEMLILGNEPGFSGKSILKKTIQRVADLRVDWLTTPIGFDIGVNAETIPVLADAGVTRFVAASAIFGTENPKTAYTELAAIGAEYEKLEEGE